MAKNRTSAQSMDCPKSVKNVPIALFSFFFSIAWLLSMAMVPCGAHVPIPEKPFQENAQTKKPLSQGEKALHEQMVSSGMNPSVTIAQLRQETNALEQAVRILEREKEALYESITKKKKISKKEYEEIRIKSKKINDTFQEVTSRYDHRILNPKHVGPTSRDDRRDYFTKHLLGYTMRRAAFLFLTFEWREWKDYFFSEEPPYPDFIEAEKLLEREKDRPFKNSLRYFTELKNFVTLYPTQPLEKRKKMFDHLVEHFI